MLTALIYSKLSCMVTYCFLGISLFLPFLTSFSFWQFFFLIYYAHYFAQIKFEYFLELSYKFQYFSHSLII